MINNVFERLNNAPYHGEDAFKELEGLVNEKLSIKDISKEEKGRLNYELSFIKKCGMAKHFLFGKFLVQTTTEEYKKRGKIQYCETGTLWRGGCSYVNFLLGNSPVNPVIYNLPFEKYFNEYRNFFIYKSFNNEVDTSRLIEHFLSQNKMVAYPVTQGDNMLAGIDKSNEKTFSKFGTEEPTEYIEMEKIDVCFLPLLAFDKNKNRLGYGKGYYDRFLKDFTGITIGLCYDSLVVESVPREKTDMPVDILITEKEEIFINAT
jgi:5-formyltetrahydrofolate cyclo-ligase